MQSIRWASRRLPQLLLFCCVKIKSTHGRKLSLVSERPSQRSLMDRGMSSALWGLCISIEMRRGWPVKSKNRKKGSSERRYILHTWAPCMKKLDCRRRVKRQWTNREWKMTMMMMMMIGVCLNDPFILTNLSALVQKALIGVIVAVEEIRKNGRQWLIFFHFPDLKNNSSCVIIG